MKKLLAIFAILFGALGAFVAIDQPLPEPDFTYLEVTDLFTLDPQRMSYLQDFRVAYAIYEGLTRCNNDTMEIEPAVATSWEISPDGLTYTFHLTDQARWSNGDPVIAQDFIYSWHRAMIPDTAADYSGLFFRIAGAEEHFSWRNEQLSEYRDRPAADRSRAAATHAREQLIRHFDQTVGLRAPDPHTLEVTLARPTPFFLDLCAFPCFYPVHPPTTERFLKLSGESGIIEQDHSWTKPHNIVCNGPYKPVVWKFKRELRFERNPQYWRPQIVKLDSVRMVPIEDANTAVLAYTTGAVQWHSDVGVDYMADMLEQQRRGERNDIHTMPAFGTYFWNFNCTPRLSDGRENPFHDARVRRAFAMCVDKQTIVDKVKRTGERVATVLIPRNSIPGFQSPKGVPHDPTAARILFEEAGWTDRNGDGIPENEAGVDFPTVELLCTPISYHKSVALAMAQMWQETLGIRSKVVIRESKVYKDNLKRKDYMMARGGWFGDFSDPTTFLDLHRTGDGNNDRGYSSSYVDDLLAKADNELDVENRMSILEEIERFTMDEEVPLLPIWQYDLYYMFKPPTDENGNPIPGGLRGISHHPRLNQYIWELEVVK